MKLAVRRIEKRNMNKNILNMKKSYFLCLSGLLLCTIVCLLTSCSKDDEEKPNDTSKTVTITIENARIRGNYLLEDSWGSLSNNWSESGFSFDVYLVQGSNLWSVGRIHSNENSVSNKKANLTIDIPINSQIDMNNPYKAIAVDYLCGAKLENGAIVCNADLEKADELRVFAWYIADLGLGYGSIAQAKYITASEVLTIHNKTNKSIKIRHKGYEAKEKWYYTNANVKIVNSSGINAIVEGKATGTDAISSEFEIDAGEKGYVLTRFAPTGKKMTNARLILEIDGKEVKSEPASSEVTIENGIPYFLVVEWDGQSLVWNRSVY